MEFEGLAPAWLLRLLVDGALGTLQLGRSLIALTFFAWCMFWAIDAALSTADKYVVMKVFGASLLTSQHLGSPVSRFRFQLSRLPGWILKAWVGLPMFSVVQLILSREPAAPQKLRSIASGYVWEEKVIAQIPSFRFWRVPEGSWLSALLLWAIVAAFLYYTYFYWSRGFEVTRRIRVVADQIAALVGGGNESPTIFEAGARLSAAGWTPEAVASGLWFLTTLNIRIMLKNPVFGQLTPGRYGVFRAVSAFTVATALTAVHPILAGLKAAADIKDISEVRESAHLYRKHFAHLPREFRQTLDLVPSKYLYNSQVTAIGGEK